MNNNPHIIELSNSTIREFTKYPHTKEIVLHFREFMKNIPSTQKHITILNSQLLLVFPETNGMYLIHEKRQNSTNIENILSLL